jgi:hypothetical protein
MRGRVVITHLQSGRHARADDDEVVARHRLGIDPSQRMHVGDGFHSITSGSAPLDSSWLGMAVSGSACGPLRIFSC